VPPLRLEYLVGKHPEVELRLATLDAMACSDRNQRIETIRRRGPELTRQWLPFAQRNRVAPIVAHALLDAYGSELPDRQVWETIHRQELDRMAILLNELDEIAERLHAEEIPLVALKNAGIARGIHACPGCCPMGDLDVLVEKARFRTAHQIILDQGFELESRASIEKNELEEMLRSGGTEYRKEVDGQTVWFELQWRPVAGRWIRKDQEPDGATLIARSVPIDGTRVRLLEPADNMLQVALHTAKHTYVRAPGLRLHTDVDRLALFQTPNWDTVIERAEALQVKTATWFSFALARTLLHSPVPTHVLKRLAPPRWKINLVLRWLRKVDVFEPDQQKFSRPEMIAFTALLYDSTEGLTASVLDTEPERLTLRHLPQNLQRGTRRIFDLITRYER